jgi:hypothetical protein
MFVVASSYLRVSITAHEIGPGSVLTAMPVYTKAVAPIRPLAISASKAAGPDPTYSMTRLIKNGCAKENPVAQSLGTTPAKS